MKLWIVLFVIMVVVIVGGLILEKSILKTTNHLSHSLDQVKEAVRSDQWHEALELRDEIDGKWRVQQESWTPYIHNHDLDVVAVHLARLKSFLETAEKGSALAEISMVEIQLVQLYNQEIWTIQNVF